MRTDLKGEKKNHFNIKISDFSCQIDIESLHKP